MVALPKHGLRTMTLLSIIFAVTVLSVSAQINNWSDFKRACESQGGVAYPNPARCLPKSSTGGGNSGRDEAARREKAERERIKREAEEKRLADAEKAREAAERQKAFEDTRDEAVRTLKGSEGGTTLRGGSGDTRLRDGGSTSSTDRLRGSRTDTKAAEELTESDFFFALQTRELMPMADGGHPIDGPGSKPLGTHGLVGGTTWTFGFRWPLTKCDQKCQAGMKLSLDRQLKLYCSSQSDPAQCVADGLPFTAADYDMVVSMASSHSAIEDLATRVVFDGSTFGEYSRQNKEIFASLSGRQFDTLDCHSNGAMLCLAALRSGKTTAKVVRLFGPQINPAAAERWKALQAKGVKVEIYINNGDPVPGFAWKLAMPQNRSPKLFTTAWAANTASLAATVPRALFNSFADSQTQVMDKALMKYGLEVTRFTCQNRPSLSCHSMKDYESKAR